MASPQPPNRPERKRDRAKRILKNIFNRPSSRSRNPGVVSQAASPADTRTSSPQPASVPVETTPDTRPSLPHLPTADRPSHAETRPSSTTSASVPGASSAGVADKIKAIARVAGSGLETTIRLLEKSAAACPPLQSAAGGLVACLNLAQVSSGR